MVAGSFFLTPATALRYEKHDRKVKQLSQEEAMGLGKDRRRVDMREEYYVSPFPHITSSATRMTEADSVDRNWPQKISIIGRIDGSKDYQASRMVFCNELLVMLNSTLSYI